MTAAKHDLGEPCPFCGRFSRGHAPDCAALLGLFAPVSGEAKRDAAVAANDERVTRERGGDALVERVTDALLALPTFTADDVARELDAAGVPTDLATRRRLTSVVVNRGKGKLWDAAGYERSHDPRRNARPVVRWVRRVAA